MAFAAVEDGEGKVRGGVVVKPLTEIGKTDKTGRQAEMEVTIAAGINRSSQLSHF